MLTQQLLKIATVGGEWILYALIALSVWSMGIITDRWIFFLRRRIDVAALGQEILEHLRRGELDAITRKLAAHRSIEAAIVAECLPWLEDGPDAVSERLAASLRDRRPAIEQGTTYLGTLGNNAPFVGLLGTVLGVVHAFQELGADSMGAMGTVMSGIGEALVATAVGIVVALPAVVAFNVLSKKAAAVEDNAQSLMNLVLAFHKSTREDRSLVGKASDGKGAEKAAPSRQRDGAQSRAEA